MKRWVGFLGHLVIVVVLTSFGTNSFKAEEVELSKYAIVRESSYVLFPNEFSESLEEDYNSVFLKKDFLGFKEAVAFKESQGNYSAVNTLGYLGKYQFGTNTLKLMGVKAPYKFLDSPMLQESVFELNVSRNKWILRRDIKRFVGKRINGTVISESGIIAASHLAGAGNVKKYLRSYGKNDFSDAYGSSIAYYMNKFKGFDISPIKAVQNPKI